VVLAIGLVLRSWITRTRGTPLQFVIALVVLIGLGMIFVVLPTVLVRPHPDLAREQLLKARNDIRTAGIQIVGGTALLAGLVFTNRTLGLNQQGQITDRFTKATDQLGSDKLDIRLGGIYSMERIARDSKNDQGPVMEVLTAFVRDHAPATPTSTASTGTTSTVPTDVQAVLTVVGRRNVLNDPEGYRPNLGYTDLTRANLSGANLSLADLSLADLTDAELSLAGLGGADLTRANLSGANLSLADLTGANLTGADLTRANLSGAHLIIAILTDANLTRANLSGVRLGSVIGLVQAQIDSAATDPTTELPPGIHRSQTVPTAP
jgi:hypothetical protein